MTPLKNELKALKEKKKALNEINMKEIESLLTPEQFMKFKALKANRKKTEKEKVSNNKKGSKLEPFLFSFINSRHLKHFYEITLFIQKIDS